MFYWYAGLHVTVVCRSSEDFPYYVWISAGHRGGQDGPSFFFFLMHCLVLLVSWFLGTCYYECVPSVNHTRENTGWFKKMDSMQKEELNFVRLYGMWMIYIPPLERPPWAQPCRSVSWEQNGYYAAQDYLSLVLILKYRLTKLSPSFWITLYFRAGIFASAPSIR